MEAESSKEERGELQGIVPTYFASPQFLLHCAILLLKFSCKCFQSSCLGMVCDEFIFKHSLTIFLTAILKEQSWNTSYTWTNTLYLDNISADISFRGQDWAFVFLILGVILILSWVLRFQDRSSSLCTFLPPVSHTIQVESSQNIWVTFDSNFKLPVQISLLHLPYMHTCMQAVEQQPSSRVELIVKNLQADCTESELRQQFQVYWGSSSHCIEKGRNIQWHKSYISLEWPSICKRLRL